MFNVLLYNICNYIYLYLTEQKISTRPTDTCTIVWTKSLSRQDYGLFCVKITVCHVSFYQNLFDPEMG